MFNAETLKDLRLRNGLTQQEFADKLGVARELMSKMESGKKSISKATQVLLSNYAAKVNKGTIESRVAEDEVLYNTTQWKDKYISALEQTVSTEKLARELAIEAKEAYKEIARLRELPAGEYVTRERFDVAELRTQVLRSWTVDTFAKQQKVSPKVLEGELGKRIEETLQIYMQGTSPAVNTLSMQE